MQPAPIWPANEFVQPRAAWQRESSMHEESISGELLVSGLSVVIHSPYEVQKLRGELREFPAASGASLAHQPVANVV